MRFGNVTAVQLVQLADVQKELKLTDEQVGKVNAAFEELAVGRGQVMSTIAKESGQRGPKLAKLNEKSNADVKAALDESQRLRLQELLLQVNGAAELLNEEIQDQLHLTDGQKEKLKEVQRANAKARRDARADLSGDRWTAMVELQKEANAKLLEVLIPEQQKQFEKMQGEKIAIDLFGV
jgi:Spy/CpxP family protein refolding chaperone